MSDKEITIISNTSLLKVNRKNIISINATSKHQYPNMEFFTIIKICFQLNGTVREFKFDLDSPIKRDSISNLFYMIGNGINIIDLTDEDLFSSNPSIILKKLVPSKYDLEKFKALK